MSPALIRRAFDRRIPLFAICRGMQEMVVATQGTLHRRLYELPELQEHREDHDLPLEQQYAPAHEVIVQEGGLLSQLIPDCNRFWVNSLHGGCQNHGRERSHRGARRRRAGGGDQRARSAFRARRAVAPGVEQRRVRPVAPVV